MSELKNKRGRPSRGTKLSGAALANFESSKLSVHSDTEHGLATTPSDANVNKGGRPSKASKLRGIAKALTATRQVQSGNLGRSSEELSASDNISSVQADTVPSPQKRVRSSVMPPTTQTIQQSSNSNVPILSISRADADAFIITDSAMAEPMVDSALNQASTSRVQVHGDISNSRPRMALPLNLNGYATLAEAIENYEAGPVQNIFAFNAEIRDALQDRTVQLEGNTVFAYMCFAAYICTRPVAVVNIAFTMNREAGYLADVEPRTGAWGELDAFEVLIIPVYLSAHFCVVIYERGQQSAIFYDPLANRRNRLSANLKNLLMSCIDAFEPQLAPGSIDIVRAADNSFNPQTDGINCGVHVCIIVEAYLMNGSALLSPEDFDIWEERERILQHLFALSQGQTPVYYRRYFTKVVEEDEEEEGEVMLQESPSMQQLNAVQEDICGMQIGDCPAQQASRSSTPRRSARIRQSDARLTLAAAAQPVGKSKLTSIVNCHKKHRRLGCFAITAGHYYDRYDCGKFGDNECKLCGALLLNNENSAVCCANGTVRSSIVDNGPERLRNLFEERGDRTHLIQSSRAYNSLLRFGYMESGHDIPSGIGAPVLLMNGDVRYKLTNVFSKRGTRAAHGQLYLMDPDAATDAVSTNSSLFKRLNLRRHIFAELLRILQQFHPLAHDYCTFAKLYKDAVTEAKAQGRSDVPTATIYLVNEKEIPDILRDKQLHPRQVNLPTCAGELAVVYIHNDSFEPPEMPRTRLRCIDGAEVVLYEYDPILDTTHYPLLFPTGQLGYRTGIEKVYEYSNPTSASAVPEFDDGLDNVLESGMGKVNFDDPKAKRKYVSLREFQRYRLALRGDRQGSDHFLFSKGSLVQEYLIDQSFRVQRQHYNFLRERGQLFMADTEQLRAAIARGAPDNFTVGKIMRLEASVYGSPRWYQQQFYDGMTIFTRVGKATFMITLTANNSWPEVKALLARGMRPVDRPDVLNRVFYAREKEIRRLITERGVFGNAIGYVASLEFQKRGPPHTHSLITVDGATMDADLCDAYIQAEIPSLPPVSDKSREAADQRRLRDYVLKYHVHSCDQRCLVNDVCNKGFPKPFSDRTYVHEDKSPVYRRRSPEDGGETYKRKGVVITNAMIVPYNPALLLSWDGHANVEFAYGTMACKYAVKYAFKGQSYAYVRQEQSNTGVGVYDESVALLKGVYRSANEAHTILYSWRLIRMSHTVVRLSIYEPGQAPGYFRRGQEEKALAQALDEDVRLGYFEHFMRQCAEERKRGISVLRKLLYPEVPTEHRFDKKKQEWVKRKRERSILARVYAISPSKAELFAIYQLVHHIRGPCSWQELRTVPGRSVPCETFTECAVLMGLIDDGAVWDRTLAEAAPFLTPRQMRRLFVQILVFGSASDHLKLWNKYKQHFYDGRGAGSAVEIQRRTNKALLLINRMLHYYGCNTDYGLPLPKLPGFSPLPEIDEAFFGNRVEDDDNQQQPDPTIDACVVSNNPVASPPIYSYASQRCYKELNDGQKEVVKCVMTALQDRRATRTLHPRLIFMTGRGGTGKTYAYGAIIQLCELFKLRCLVTASTGTAATLLKRGTTAHSAFRLPLDDNDEKCTPAITASEYQGIVIARTDLIIIDEITMFHKSKLSQIDNACRHCSDKSLAGIPFAGKVVLIGGDFRQLLPVVPKSNLVTQANATVKNSPLFGNFHTIHLRENMRVEAGQESFQQLLDDVATDSNGSGKFTIPECMRLHSQDELVQFVYGGGPIGLEHLEQKLLLAPMRSDVQRLNDKVLNLLTTAYREYLSTDTPKKVSALDVHAAIHDVPSLNNETPPGMPPHKLCLKIGSIVVLLRNISIKEGLSNGTRLIVKGFGNDLLYCKIATGPYKGKEVPLARMELEYAAPTIYGDGLHFTRLQFPVQLAFALTINKAQGQTVTRLGLLIRSNVFSHGQLYVAMSRVRAQYQLKIYAEQFEREEAACITNVVVKSVL